MKLRFFFIATGLACLAALLETYLTTENRPQSKDDETAERFSNAGFRVSKETDAYGNQALRMRGSWEALKELTDPGYSQTKPPLPDDLCIEDLRNYSCGCPHCGKTSMVGENQWRYQELSRTRGYMDNTTTYLVRCQNCQGFMKSKVDHDD